MKTMKNPISYVGGPGWVEMADCDGKKLYIHPKATLADLVKAGVCRVGISKPEDPLENGEYRDTGKTPV